jgi:xylan 1,4-beta-xylosidase
LTIESRPSNLARTVRPLTLGWHDAGSEEVFMLCSRSLVIMALAFGTIAQFSAAAEGAGLRLDGTVLGSLPSGVTVHPSVERTTEGGRQALRFTKGGFTVAMSDRLLAGAGTVDVECQMPANWPAEEDRALFHLGEKEHVHVTLFFRKGSLIAVYKGGKEYFAAIRHAPAREWKPGSWHRVRFSWQAVGQEVDFFLTTDGKLAGTAVGRLIEEWPATCTVGVRGARTPWQGLLGDAVLSPQATRPAELSPGTRTVTVQADQPVGECYRFWTVANHNKPHLFLDAGFRKRVRPSRPFVRQANAVYLLGGRYPDQNCWYLGEDGKGGIRTDFTGMVAQLKAMLDVDYVPWVVLDNVPYSMSDPPQENTYGNTAPPEDERLWGLYVEAALKAMVEAFGRDTVETWWFRVGTEPDLTPAHWAGTREQYFAHYDVTVAAVDRVIPGAKVGPGNILNPAGGEFKNPTRDQWGLDIIDHAANGANACTGGKGARMDWFSFSWYARVGQPIRAFDAAVAAVRNRLRPYPQFEDLPLVVGEFTVLHDERGRRLWGGDTTEWAASFYAALADRVYGYGIRQVYEWSQVTGGLLHPRTQVIEMLDGMAGGTRLRVDVEKTSANASGAIACRKGDDLFVLLYNHHFMRRPKVPEAVHLQIRDARMREGEEWKLSERLIDADHGVWAYAFAADCLAAGLTPDPKAGSYEGAISFVYGKDGAPVLYRNLEKYRKIAAPQMVRKGEPLAVGSGGVTLDLDLTGHSVHLLKLSP